MLTNFRLEIIFICFLGLLAPKANLILFLIIIFFFLMNLFINFILLKDLKENKNRLKELQSIDKDAENNKNSIKIWIRRMSYFISLLGILLISIYLKSVLLFFIAAITILIETYKIYKIKKMVKDHN